MTLAISDRRLIQGLGCPIQRSPQQGWEVPDFFWAQEKLRPVFIPGYGDILMHAAVAYSLDDTLANDVDFLSYRVNVAYGWSTRRKMLDPHRGLSLHAFGLAFDINPSTNRVGARGDIPAELVTALEAGGWAWGGRWKNPDPMHFQPCESWLERIIEERQP